MDRRPSFASAMVLWALSGSVLRLFPGYVEERRLFALVRTISRARFAPYLFRGQNGLWSVLVRTLRGVESRKCSIYFHLWPLTIRFNPRFLPLHMAAPYRQSIRYYAALFPNILQIHYGRRHEAFKFTRPPHTHTRTHTHTPHGASFSTLPRR